MSNALFKRLVALALALIALAVYAAAGPIFHLHRVAVAGDSWVVSEDEVRSGLARSGKMSLLFGDFSQLADTVASLSPVRAAVVSLDPPNGLRLFVHAREPYARSVDGGLIDSNGEWYQSETDEDLPIFDMSRSLMPQAVEFHTDASADLDEHGFGIIQLDHEWDGWRVTLSNGWVVLIGEHKKRERFGRFVRALPDLRLALQETGSLRFDMRYPHGLAVAGWTERAKGEGDG